MPQLYSHSPLAVCKSFSLRNRGKAQHVLVKKEKLRFPVEGHWFLNLGKWVRCYHTARQSFQWQLKAEKQETSSTADTKMLFHM